MFSGIQISEIQDKFLHSETSFLCSYIRTRYLYSHYYVKLIVGPLHNLAEISSVLRLDTEWTIISKIALYLYERV